jgi:DNA-binding response OmpR family regulator
VALRVLCIDDDVRLYELLAAYLEPNGVTLVHAADGPKGLAALGADVFDAVLLDVMMPGMDGLAVCRRIREQSRVPIIMLTARGDEADRVVGLELGADDYVPKPFNPRELLARVRAVLRRARPSAGSPTSKLTIGPIAIDVAGRTVQKNGAPVTLTSYEFRILVELARRVGETVTREDLAASLHEQGKGKAAPAYDPSVDRSLDVHVSRLRQKLEEDPKDPRFIKTVRGVGYVFARPS